LSPPPPIKILMSKAKEMALRRVGKSCTHVPK